MAWKAIMRGLVVLCVLSAGIVGGCARSQRGDLGSLDNPVVCLLSHAHTAGATPVDLTSMERMLEEASGLDIEVRSAATGAEALAAIGRRDVHFGILPLFEYLLAHREYGAHARLRIIRAVNVDPRVYAGDILVRHESGLTRVEQLEGREVAFVDPYSVSGYILPLALLARHGVKVRKTFAGSHDAALELLRSGRADAAATYAGVARNDPALEVLGTTEKIPNEPVFVTPGLEPEIEAKILDAIQLMATTPEGRRILNHLAHISGFEPVDDSAYTGATQVVSSAGKFIQDLVPGAREMSWADQAGWPL